MKRAISHSYKTGRRVLLEVPEGWVRVGPAHAADVMPSRGAENHPTFVGSQTLH
jgi:hypothetical protein